MLLRLALAALLVAGAVGADISQPSLAGPDAVAREVGPWIKRCASGDAEACNRLLVRMQRPANKAEQESYPPRLQAGCASGAKNACAGVLFAKAVGIGGKPSGEAGVDLRKLCESSKESHACSYLVDIAVEAGHSSREDLTPFTPLMQRSCDAMKGPACKVLAQFSAGAEAEKLSERACDGGDGYACYELGLAYDHASNAARALSAYQRACDLLWPEGCFNLAWAEKKAGKADAFQVLAERACRLGDSKACDDLAKLADETGDKTANARYCALWGASACYGELASLSAAGETAEQAERIVGLALLSCERGFGGACRTLQHALNDAQKGCASADKAARRNSCAMLGFGQLRGDRFPQEMRAALHADREHAVASLKSSCEAGAKVACAAAAAR